MRIVTFDGETATLGNELDLATVYDVNGCAISLIAANKISVALHYDPNTGGQAAIDVFNVTISGTTITSYIANKISKTNGYITINQPIDSVVLDTDVLFVFYSKIGGALDSWKVSFSGNVPSDVSTTNLDSSGIAQYVSAEKTCSNAGNQQALITWYDSAPAYNARTVKVDNTTGTLCNLASNPITPFSGTYFSLCTIEIDSTSGNSSRSFLITSAGYLYEIITTGTTARVVYAFYNAGFAKNWTNLCLTDIDRKTFVLVCDSTLISYSFAEYDNSARYIGCVVANADEGDPVVVRTIGDLGGFSGLVVGSDYFFDLDSYDLTRTPNGRYAFTAISTTEIDIKARKNIVSGIDKQSRLENAGTGYQKIYHNLGKKPEEICITSGHESTAGKLSTCFADTYDGVNTVRHELSTESTPSSISYLSTNGTIISLVGSVAVISRVDDFTVTLDFTTHDAGLLNGNVSFGSKCKAIF